jgi:tetratricopeptide (TPR) repeat protein
MSRSSSLNLLLPVVLAFSAAGQTQTETLSRLYAEAREAQAADKYEVAVRKYEQVVRLSPALAEAHANLGSAYYALGKWDPAAAAFSKAIRLKPELTGPHFFLGVISFQEHAYEAALRHLAAAEKLEPANPLVQSYLGYTQYGLANYGAAAQHLETAISVDETNQDLLYHLSKTYAYLAKQQYQALQTAFPDTLFADLALAHAHETAERWQPAREAYTRALQKQPDNARLQKKVEQAAAKAAGVKIEDDGPGDPTIDGSLDLLRAPPSSQSSKDIFRSYIARAQAVSNQPAKTAESMYTIAEIDQALSYLASLQIVQDPDSYRSHQLKGESLEASGKDDDAIVEYRKALQQKAELPNVHFSIGTILWKTNRLTEAIPELRAELHKNPNHPPALYELGDALAEGGELTEAEKCLQKAARLDPRMVEPHLALEKIYTGRNEFKKSLQQLRTALQLDGSSPIPHYRMANIYRKLGRRQEADQELAIFTRMKAADTKSSRTP